MITLEPTADGSNTLYVPELNEHYHSVKGALTESAHIFIQMGLNHAQAVNPHVLEIGFGTGLNAFLTLLEAEKSQKYRREGKSLLTGAVWIYRDISACGSGCGSGS